MNYLKRFWFWLTAKKNYNHLKNEIIPNQTIISAMPWWSVRYRGIVDKSGIFHCWAVYDSVAVMGVPIEKCYNIRLENMQERQSYKLIDFPAPIYPSTDGAYLQ